MDNVLGHYMTIEQVDRPAGIICVGGRMGHHYDSGAGFIQIRKHLHHFVAMTGVQIAGRFVRQDHFGTSDHGSRHRHALLLTAG